MAKNSPIHFEVSERKVLLRVFDIVFVLLVLSLVSTVFKFYYFDIPTLRWVSVFFLAGYLTVFATVFELYDLQKTNSFPRVFQNIILTTALTVLFYLLTPFYTPSLPANRLQILFFFFSILAALVVWRLAYIQLIASPRFFKKVLLVGNRYDVEKLKKQLETANPHYIVIGFVHYEEYELSPNSELKQISTEALADEIRDLGIGEIVICDSEMSGLNEEIFHGLILLLESGFSIKPFSQVYEDLTSRIPIDYIKTEFYKYLPFSRNNQNQLYLFFSRFLDYLFSILGILIGICLLPFVLIGNLFGNRGPLFYQQKRVGKGGHVFSIVKLRTMVVNAEKDGARWSQANDIRITKFGKFLRHTRFDEIPQFYNVIKGEMSLIGPRPERPVFVRELSAKNTFYPIRHSIKPGLTGWAQVSTDYGSSTEDSMLKLQYDLYYIKHRGAFLDFRIWLKTLSTIIFFRGQ